MRKPTISLGLAALAGLVLVPLAGEALAQARRSPGYDGAVHVCSRYGRGCVSGPTRPGRWGLEVRLPGGTWIECKGDCRQTLREESVDFFETLRERSPSHRR